MATQGEVSVLLKQWAKGDISAESRLFELVYPELHRIAKIHMRRERRNQTLQTTALVNEAYLKLRAGIDAANSTIFFAFASKVMRSVLVDHARQRLSRKRGGGVRPLPLEEGLVFSEDQSTQLVALDQALNDLQSQDPRAGRVIELRFFGGLSIEDAAEVLQVSPRTVKRDWRFGRAWLREQLSSD